MLLAKTPHSKNSLKRKRSRLYKPTVLGKRPQAQTARRKRRYKQPGTFCKPLKQDGKRTRTRNSASTYMGMHEHVLKR